MTLGDVVTNWEQSKQQKYFRIVLAEDGEAIIELTSKSERYLLEDKVVFTNCSWLKRVPGLDEKSFYSYGEDGTRSSWFYLMREAIILTKDQFKLLRKLYREVECEL